jgi:hypothetical protein
VEGHLAHIWINPTEDVCTIQSVPKMGCESIKGITGRRDGALIYRVIQERREQDQPYGFN